MDRDPPNPYIHMTLRELSNAMGTRAGDLLKDGPVGRRDTAYLLIAAGRRIDPMTAHPNSPVNQVKGGGTALEAFLPVYEAEARAARYWVLIHSNDALCAQHGVERLLPHGRWDAQCALAVRDAEGLRAAIMALDQAAAALKT